MKVIANGQQQEWSKNQDKSENQTLNVWILYGRYIKQIENDRIHHVVLKAGFGLWRYWYDGRWEK